jgi:excisionase family DNA binding protein
MCAVNGYLTGMKHKNTMKQMKHNKIGANKVLTLAEVAAELRISRTTAWRLVTGRELLAFRVGKGWRVLREELGNFIQRRTS